MARVDSADAAFARHGRRPRGGPETTHDVDFVLVEDDALQVLEGAGLRIVDPPEDWLVKVYDGECLIDLIFRPSDRPITRGATPRRRTPARACVRSVGGATRRGDDP